MKQIPSSEKLKHHEAFILLFKFLRIFSLPFYCRGGQANFFFKSLQIANPHIPGLIPQSQIRKILMCASPQIANPQIFMIFLQIANLQISTKYCTTVLKVVFLNDFCVCTFELEHYMLYL
jgi:hypothetical protein